MMNREHEMKEHDRWITSVCDHLNRLLQLDVDAACTYREALLHVDESVVRDDLEAFLHDHERHVRELTGVIRDLGGAPVVPHRDFKGAVLEGMTKLRSRGTLGTLRAMRMNERITNRGYSKALDKFMPPIGQVIVMENLDDERRHLAVISAHIVRLSGNVDIPRTEQKRSDRDRPFPGM
jgi:rubrerythrin